MLILLTNNLAPVDQNINVEDQTSTKVRTKKNFSCW